MGDEDLKIVLSTTLSADEEGSAQKISSQLPSIAAKVNQRGDIKIRVSLDEHAGVQAQQYIQSVSKTVSAHPVGIKVSLDHTSAQRLQDELHSIGANDDVIAAMSESLGEMGVQIDRVSARWAGARDEAESLLSLTIQGTDQLGRTVSLLQTYNAESQEVEIITKNVALNLEAQRQAEERAQKVIAANNDERSAYIRKQADAVASLSAVYQGLSSPKKLLDEGHIADVENAISDVNTAIASLQNNSGKLSKEEQANIESQIAALKRLIKEYQNAEYVATSLRTKDIGTIKIEKGNELDQYASKLKSAGLYTQDFEKSMTELRGTLDSVSSGEGLTRFLNDFDTLKSKVSAFSERVRELDKLYDALSRTKDKSLSIMKEMNQTDGSSQKYAALKQELAIQNENAAAIRSQIVAYDDVAQASKKSAEYIISQVERGAELNTQAAELADQATNITKAMQSMPSVVSDIHARFATLTNPTEELKNRIVQMDAAMREFANAKTDKEKISSWGRLQEAIKGCNKEISALKRTERIDLLDDKFETNLKKAKSDLEAISRQWSAFRSDKGLKKAFDELAESYEAIDNPQALERWRAQLAALKSEIKAAGKNTMGFFDTLRNNLGKVTQWLSATTILFKAFGFAKSGIQSVIDLNTAMIDLRKTTEATSDEYQRFYVNANKTAKELGSTTQEVISQTAEWSRLGYTLNQAAVLARNSSIFSSISEDLDISSATDGLISIIKAFDIEVEDTLDGIISKVNEIGNKYAVTNSDIVNALLESSSAMAAANNTFDQTIALATAAIEITRDAREAGKMIARSYSNVA